MTTKTRDESATGESRSATILIRNAHKGTTLRLSDAYHVHLSAMGMIALTKSQVRATTQLRNSAMRILARVTANVPAVEAVRNRTAPRHKDRGTMTRQLKDMFHVHRATPMITTSNLRLETVPQLRSSAIRTLMPMTEDGRATHEAHNPLTPINKERSSTMTSLLSDMYRVHRRSRQFATLCLLLYEVTRQG